MTTIKAAAERWLADKHSDGIAPNQSSAEDRAALADFATSLLDETAVAYSPDITDAESALGTGAMFCNRFAKWFAFISALEIKSIGQLRALLLACGDGKGTSP